MGFNKVLVCAWATWRYNYEEKNCVALKKFSPKSRPTALKTAQPKTFF
jgi:hypothetical protein